MSVLSPASDDAIFKITDEGIAAYVEFPPDTIFMESVASHESFRKGVGFVAAQRTTGPNGGQPETFVYEISPGMKEAKELFGPLANKDGSTTVTVFGSAITSDGILYLTAFNRNSVIDYDMKNMPASGSPAVYNMEIPNLPSPNDVCIDPKNEKIMYVCGGTFRKLYPFFKTFCNSAYGQVFKVTFNEDRTDTTVEVVKKGVRTLAGIEVIGDDVWTAQLYDIFTLNQTKDYELSTVWKGNDTTGNVWLADNIDVFDDGELVMSPAYTTTSERSVNLVMKRSLAMSSVLFYYQMLTKFHKKETWGQALWDPEVSLAISNTYIEEGVDPSPVRIAMMSPDGTQGYHFEIDLKETRANHEPWEPQPGGPKRHYFNEQVTHASHLRTDDGTGYIVCVNFEQPRILLLQDQTFKECIAKKKNSST